jgi:hypothetical protein
MGSWPFTDCLRFTLLHHQIEIYWIDIRLEHAYSDKNPEPSIPNQINISFHWKDLSSSIGREDAQNLDNFENFFKLFRAAFSKDLASSTAF